MNILYVLPFFNFKRGGTVTVPYQLAREIQKYGYNACILTTDFELDESILAESSKDNIEVHVINNQINLALFLYSPKIKDWLKKNLTKFDIIHLHNYRTYQNIVVSKYARRFNIPYVLQAHGSLLRDYGKTILKTTYDLVWGYEILRFANRVVALTEQEVEQYIMMGVKKRRISLIPNAIDVNAFTSLSLNGAFRKKYNIPEKDKIILFLGRIHKIKGLDLLLDAYRKIRNEYDDVKLVVVGPDDGYLHQFLDRVNKLGLERDVIVTGPLFGVEKLSAYVDADLFVLPSMYETFPMTILESYMCGTPAVVTQNASASSLIREICMISEPTENALKKNVLRLLSDEVLRNEVVNVGKKAIIKNYSWEKILPKYVELYEQML